MSRAASVAGGGDARGRGGGEDTFTTGAGRGHGDSGEGGGVEGEEGGIRGGGSDTGERREGVWDFQMYDVHERKGGWDLILCALPPDPVVMCVAACAV